MGGNIKVLVDLKEMVFNTIWIKIYVIEDKIKNN